MEMVNCGCVGKEDKTTLTNSVNMELFYAVWKGGYDSVTTLISHQFLVICQTVVIYSQYFHSRYCE